MSSKSALPIRSGLGSVSHFPIVVLSTPRVVSDVRAAIASATGAQIPIDGGSDRVVWHGPATQLVPTPSLSNIGESKSAKPNAFSASINTFKARSDRVVVLKLNWAG
jgi:hypothetical protein